MEFLRETTIFKRIVSLITKRIFQFFRIALFLYLLYDIKISLKKMNSELWKILCFKISSERLLYDSFFFFFLQRYTTIYNIDNFYRIYIVNFLKIKIKMIMCMEKKIIQKIHFDIYLEATQVLFQWNPHIFLINQYYLYR